MGFEIRTLGNRIFLVYAVSPSEQINPAGIFDVSTQLMKGFCPVKYSKTDGFIEYDITDKISLNDYFGKEVGKKELLCVLDSLLDALIVAREHKIDLRTILLDSNYIFVNSETAQTSFVVLPLAGVGYPADLNAFFKNIVCNIRFADTEDSQYVAELLNFLNKSRHFIYEDFKALIKSISGRQSLEDFMAVAETEESDEAEDIVEIITDDKPEPTPMFRKTERSTLTAEEILGTK